MITHDDDAPDIILRGWISRKNWWCPLNLPPLLLREMEEEDANGQLLLQIFANFQRLDGRNSEPSIVDMPIYFVHSATRDSMSSMQISSTNWSRETCGIHDGEIYKFVDCTRRLMEWEAGIVYTEDTWKWCRKSPCLAKLQYCLTEKHKEIEQY